MEWTIFVCDHNIMMDLDNDDRDLFWQKYYKEFLDEVIPIAIDKVEKIENSSDFVNLFIKSTKCVYDINIKSPVSTDTDLTESEIASQLLFCYANKNQDNFPVQRRDAYRELLEDLIKWILSNPHEAAINDLEVKQSLRIFESQSDYSRVYDIESWRNNNLFDVRNLIRSKMYEMEKLVDKQFFHENLNILWPFPQGIKTDRIAIPKW